MFTRLGRPFRSRRTRLRLAAAVLVVGLAAPQAWAWARLRGGEAALGRYHPDEARDRLAACLRVWPDSARAHLLASRAARQAGDLDAASRQLRACQRLAGTTDEVAFEWALLQAAAGNVREVEEHLQTRVDRDPSAGPLVWEALVEGYLQVFRTIDAMATADHWLALDPVNPRALELRAITFVTGRGVSRGADDFRAAVERDPARPGPRRWLVRCLLDLGGYDEALKHLEWLTREYPDDPDLQAQTGRCLIVRQQYDDARRVLDAAVGRHPDHGLVLRTRGQLALAEGRWPEAEDWLRKAAGVWPNDYQTQFFLSTAILQQGRREEAAAQLRTANEVKDQAERVGELRSRKLADQPLDPALHYEMGRLMLGTGRPAEGERWLLSAVALDPDFAPAHAALADYYEKTGKPAQAREHRAYAAPK